MSTRFLLTELKDFSRGKEVRNTSGISCARIEDLITEGIEIWYIRTSYFILIRISVEPRYAAFSISAGNKKSVWTRAIFRTHMGSVGSAIASNEARVNKIDKQTATYSVR